MRHTFGDPKNTILAELAFPEANVFVIPNMHGYQVEFNSIADELSIRPGATCKIYGGVVGAVQICLSTGAHQEMLFGR
jgi:hypothetical protein